MTKRPKPQQGRLRVDEKRTNKKQPNSQKGLKKSNSLYLSSPSPSYLYPFPAPQPHMYLSLRLLPHYTMPSSLPRRKTTTAHFSRTLQVQVSENTYPYHPYYQLKPKRLVRHVPKPCLHSLFPRISRYEMIRGIRSGLTPFSGEQRKHAVHAYS